MTEFCELVQFWKPKISNHKQYHPSLSPINFSGTFVFLSARCSFSITSTFISPACHNFLYPFTCLPLILHWESRNYETRTTSLILLPSMLLIQLHMNQYTVFSPVNREEDSLLPHEPFKNYIPKTILDLSSLQAPFFTWIINISRETCLISPILSKTMSLTYVLSPIPFISSPQNFSQELSWCIISTFSLAILSSTYFDVVSY